MAGEWLRVAVIERGAPHFKRLEKRVRIWRRQGGRDGRSSNSVDGTRRSPPRLTPDLGVGEEKTPTLPSLNLRLFAFRDTGALCLRELGHFLVWAVLETTKQPCSRWRLPPRDKQQGLATKKGKETNMNAAVQKRCIVVIFTFI
jgi:hypothetical protein